MADSYLPFYNTKHIESGMKAYDVEAGSYAGYSVTFDRAFSSAPIIFLTEQNNVGVVSNALGTRAMVYGTPTTSGFDYRVYNSGSASRVGNIYWAAIGD